MSQAQDNAFLFSPDTRHQKNLLRSRREALGKRDSYQCALAAQPQKPTPGWSPQANDTVRGTALTIFFYSAQLGKQVTANPVCFQQLELMAEAPAGGAELLL